MDVVIIDLDRKIKKEIKENIQKRWHNEICISLHLHNIILKFLIFIKLASGNDISNILHFFSFLSFLSFAIVLEFAYTYKLYTPGA